MRLTRKYFFVKERDQNFFVRDFYVLNHKKRDYCKNTLLC